MRNIPYEVYKRIYDLLWYELNVDISEVNDVYAIGGMTNKNYKINIKEKSYVFRLPGEGTSKMINREHEKINAELAYELNIDTKVMYFNSKTGMKISEYIENAETLNQKSAKKEENMILTAEVLRKLHKSNVVLSSKFNVFDKIELYEKLLINANGQNFKGYYEIKEKVLKLKDFLINADIEYSPCHNDTVPENFVKSGKEKIYLIDWEYSGINDPMWDLAAHFLECDFLEYEEEVYLNIYFEGVFEEKYKKRILIHKICQDLLWSLWTKIKELNGVDFGEYGVFRYNRAKENLRLLEEKYVL